MGGTVIGDAFGTPVKRQQKAFAASGSAKLEGASPDGRIYLVNLDAFFINGLKQVTIIIFRTGINRREDQIEALENEMERES